MSGDSSDALIVDTSNCASDGDFVILWGGYASVFSLVLNQGSITNNRFGNFYHDDIIGQSFGSKVRSRRGGAWLALLRPSAEMITQSLAHRTQIIYHADISMLRALLDVRPGRVICEAGTGSGSVSASLARALRPGGQLNTFEFHADRQKQAQADFEKYGVSDIVVSRHGDVCIDGFPECLNNSVHGVFLDLPAPWAAIPHVDKVLVPGGRICTFSPCIEQIDKTANELRRGQRYHSIRMFETLAVNWGVKDATGSAKSSRKRKTVGSSVPDAAADGDEKAGEADEKEEDSGPKSGSTEKSGGYAGSLATPWMSYQMPMRSHTGYLMVATKAPADEPPE
eukprot:TRINITY_DN57782_c0_g1_i1.p1 TRINITY_DN57782_c0_g1~~TRINITY_DN57782_c0_g1_i1.p1  ORF type:complete len:355 (+),score=74.96 TRINITY_DN57782_c0_g1_i1:50-1066(+)